MRTLRTLVRYIGANKDKFALAFSAIALVVSLSKAALEFVLPVDILSVVITDPKAGTPDEDSPLQVSRDGKGKLRLDPELHLSFMNTGAHALLVRSVKLISPIVAGASKLSESSCEAETTRNMEMYQFKFFGRDPRDAEPFVIAAGEIVPINISFAGIPDIESTQPDDVNISRGIPICIQLDVYDAKARHHEFKRRLFDVEIADEETVRYVTRLKDERGLVAVRHSPMWSMLH